MTLLNDWKTVLLKAWSVKLIGIAIFLDGLATAFPYLQETLGVPVGTFGALSGVVSALAMLARIFVQSDIPAKAVEPEPLPIDLPDEIEQ